MRDRPTGEELDHSVMTRLEEVGADLSRPLNVEHAIWMTSEASAEDLARTLSDKGYRVTVFSRGGEHEAQAMARRLAHAGHQVTVHEGDAVDGSWTVEATQALVVNKATIAEARAEMSELAELHGGEYDGWGATSNG